VQARIEAAVRANFLFASLNDRQMRMMLDSLTKVTFKAGEFVIRRVSAATRLLPSIALAQLLYAFFPHHSRCLPSLGNVILTPVPSNIRSTMFLRTQNS
jgi:hypothetical protein